MCCIDLNMLGTSKELGSNKQNESHVKDDMRVSRENIVALGNWASFDTFINHYQRNQMAQIDFTSTVLSEPTNEVYDASTDFPLD
ncbi:hypothetical protein HMPREF1544_10435 [Mucor circinelloides 1006PhL]|uniref:Uncharacterized protein n=1 Tax=Mucor circinelloides f. circinelloides (strain 1006PhL) TaxID=1220926 RepID=S2IYF4_MUCC1|nr:hypothetical protein HMPREF1544_10435 [Mucor circinelloides 1006PhL]